jgi:hypothetical protein
MDVPDHMALTGLDRIHLIRWFADGRLRLDHGIPTRVWAGGRRSRDLRLGTRNDS